MVRLGAAALVVATAACAGQRPEFTSPALSSAETTSAAPNPQPTSTAAPHAPASVALAPIDWGRDFVGGAGGAASGQVVTMGWINNDDLAPEATATMRAAVAYVNTELGGFGGRRVAVNECVSDQLDTLSDCEMALVGSVEAVLTGTVAVGNKALYEAFGTTPVAIGNPVVLDDFLANRAVALSGGAATVVPGLAIFAVKQLSPPPTAVAIVALDNDIGRTAAELLAKPVLDRAGVSATLITLPESADAAAISAALAGSQADLIVNLLPVRNCRLLAQALAGRVARVVATESCTTMPARDVIDGWFIASDGLSPFVPDASSGSATFVNKMAQYGPGAEVGGTASSTFANVLTLAALFQNGPLSARDMRSRVAGLGKPMMLQPGLPTCGVAPFIALCSSTMSVSRVSGERWVAVAESLDVAAG